ncbi:MAG TPA: hypothetical protein VM821_06790 [Abditibacteriaceae bacterium]|nr:hypothetical protein [Abditibacteriaceae bacterium]
MQFQHEDSEHEAIARIAKTILKYALHDAAQAVSYTKAEKDGSVSYQIRDVWHSQMSLPLYVYAPILNFHRNWFGAKNTLRLDFKEAQHQMSLRYQITAHWKSDEQNEDLIMRIERNARDEFPGMQGLKVKL